MTEKCFLREIEARKRMVKWRPLEEMGCHRGLSFLQKYIQ